MGPLPAGREGPGAPREERPVRKPPPAAGRSRGCGSRSPTPHPHRRRRHPHCAARTMASKSPSAAAVHQPERSGRAARAAGRAFRGTSVPRDGAGGQPVQRQGRFPASLPPSLPPTRKTEQEQRGAGWAGLPRCPGAALKQACVKKSPARAWAYRKSSAAAQRRASQAQQGHRLQALHYILLLRRP